MGGPQNGWPIHFSSRSYAHGLLAAGSQRAVSSATTAVPDWLGAAGCWLPASGTTNLSSTSSR